MDQAFWEELKKVTDTFDINLSGKLLVLDKIIKYCSQVQDKFQSTISLTVIEKYLEYSMMNNQGNWIKGQDYFRMDGQTEKSERSRFVKAFNNPKNTKTRLFLISTKAGGIGINLIGANRCVIFDASWNPANDTQSIYRTYRIGQKKNVFVYRFIAQGTMEEKIYQRQIAKESLSQRVIDEKQMERHFTDRELREMYDFKPDIYDADNQQVPIMPSDDLLKHLLSDCKKWISRYHEHDSLLENLLDEGLSEEERKAAWTEYEAEKQILKDVPNATNLATMALNNLTAKPYAHLIQSNSKKNESSPSAKPNSRQSIVKLNDQKSGWLNAKQNLSNIMQNNEQINNKNELNTPIDSHLAQLENNSLINSKQTPFYTHVPKTILFAERNNLQQNETSLVKFPSSEFNRIQTIDQLSLNTDNTLFNIINTAIGSNYENQENVELHTPPNLLKDHSSESSNST